MEMPFRTERTPWWLFVAAIFVVYGFIAATRTEHGSDAQAEIVALLSRSADPALQVPSGRRTGIDSNSPSLTVTVESGSSSNGSESFRGGRQGLESNDGDNGGSRLRLSEIRSLAGRLAWVRGEVTARNRDGGTARPFVAVMVKVGGEWRTVFDLVGSESDAKLDKESRSACSCGPCKGCSSRRRG